MVESLRKKPSIKDSLRYVRGVGPKIASIFEKKGINTVEDALYFIPYRYEDRRNIKKISQLRIGELETSMGNIVLMDVVNYRSRKVFEMIIGDGTGFITAKWFVFNEKLMKSRFRKGQRVIFTGDVKIFNFKKEIIHPDIEVIEDEDFSESIHYGRIVPVYSEMEGIYQKRIRRIMKEIVDGYAHLLIDPLPDQIKEKYKLPYIHEALREVHFPDDSISFASLMEKRSPGYLRLIFDDFFFLQLGFAIRKRSFARESGFVFNRDSELLKRFIESLDFELTLAQRRVIDEIIADMRSGKPMNRLLQGDVGSGKTVVAFIASLFAVDNGYQVAMMAPTEILAEQHYKNFKKYSENLGITVELLTGNVKRREREDILEGVSNGKIDILIGTHALIQENVRFHNLGFAVIDEQHRFGVLQRAALRSKGYNPHLLVMTATPIPRTLAMTVYGDLDISIIDEMPPGRKPVVTKIFSERERQKVYRIIDEEINKGHQAFIIYPIVQESEKLDLRDATRMAKKLASEVFPKYNVGLIHGKMDRSVREKIMDDFRKGYIHILVSTTVVEVGIDVPNATVMIIEHAERFGLSQLHQLRGRVGRSPYPSQCILIAKDSSTDEAKRRLSTIVEKADGFSIAEEDLKIRGPGEFFGTKQSGIPDFRVADPVRDARILAVSRKEAFDLIEKDPTLSSQGVLKEYLQRYWKGKLDLLIS